MDKLTAGFWGCYFGTTVFMLAGSALAYLHSMHRIARNAALSACLSGFVVISFLGGLPLADGDAQFRFLGIVTVATAGFLCYLLLNMLGVARSPANRLRIRLALALGCLVAIAASWLASALSALAIGLSAAFLLGAIALAFGVRSAMRGDRLAWGAVGAVLCMLVALAGLGWIATDREHAPAWVHAVSAIAATLYLATMAVVLWLRYSYLIKLHEAMLHGPGYDPITRLRSHAETGQMVDEVFTKYPDDPMPIGLLVLTVVNFYALNKLHGQAAVNHALFVSGGRLRRAVSPDIELGRLGQGGFVLVMRHCRDSGDLIDLARMLASRLSRPLHLNTSTDVMQLESNGTAWAADMGIGVLMVSKSSMSGAKAMVLARAMSRTAVGFTSRIAWFDHPSGEIVELPVLAAA